MLLEIYQLLRQRNNCGHRDFEDNRLSSIHPYSRLQRNETEYSLRFQIQYKLEKWITHPDLVEPCFLG